MCAVWPGCVHDSRIFKNSALYDKLLSGEFGNGGYLLGDSGYALHSFLLTPFDYEAAQMDISQKRFNTCLSTGSIQIEMAFGKLKRRFACLYRQLQIRLKRVCNVIIACFILHNLSIYLNDNTAFNVPH